MSRELELLLERLKSGDNDLKWVDMEVLSDLSRPQWVMFSQAWPQIPTGTRQMLIAVLVAMVEEFFEYNFDRVFQEALEDDDPLVRARAIHGLWENEDTSLIGRYVHMLQSDPDVGVRAAAAAGLAHFVYLGELEEIDGAQAVAVEDALISQVNNTTESVDVRRQALESIGFSCRPEVRDMIHDAYVDGDPRMRASAIVAMGRSADRCWRKMVLRELSNPDDAIRYQAIHACGELALAEASTQLARIVAVEQDIDMRLAAIRSLGQVGGRSARRILENVLSEGDEALYEATQDALEELAFVEECPEVMDLLRFAEESDGYSITFPDELDDEFEDSFDSETWVSRRGDEGDDIEEEYGKDEGLDNWDRPDDDDDQR